MPVEKVHELGQGRMLCADISYLDDNIDEGTLAYPTRINLEEFESLLGNIDNEGVFTYRGNGVRVTNIWYGTFKGAYHGQSQHALDFEQFEALGRPTMVSAKQTTSYEVCEE